MPIPTPFHPRTSKLSKSKEWREWSGYWSAVTYEHTHEREYFAIRNSAALIDVSPLFKYDITGPQAAAVVDRIVPRDMTHCKIGQILYSPWCDDDGKVVDAIAQYASDRPRLILHRQVLTPLDYEREYGLPEGSIYHGQMALDQLLIMRPIPGYGRYRSPVEGLYFCGGGAHPGGALTGAPGRNAARGIARDLRRKQIPSQLPRAPRVTV